MTVEQLGSIAGIILSLALAYLPRVREWYDAKDAAGKAQTMGALLVLSALGVFGLSCANLYGLVACSVEGAKDLVGVLISALTANQATYLIAVRPFRGSQG
jgi:multisubunit Na+/H+ antiporter MnhG subunit